MNALNWPTEIVLFSSIWPLPNPVFNMFELTV